MDGFKMDEIVIIEDEDEVFRYCGDIVKQHVKCRFDGDRLGGVEERQGFLPGQGRYLLQGTDAVVPESDRVVFGILEGEPCGREFIILNLLAEESGLTESRRGGHQGEAVVQDTM